MTHTEPKLADVWTRVNGRAMYARVSTGGEAGAPPMVLVHGLGVSGRYLLPTARRLMNDYPVYVPDLPGWGKSERPPHALTVPQAADALAAWMRQMRLAEACLVGNSLGCQFIIDLAVRYPELVGWAVLVGPTVDPAARSVFGQALSRHPRPVPRALELLAPVDLGLPGDGAHPHTRHASPRGGRSGRREAARGSRPRRW